MQPIALSELPELRPLAESANYRLEHAWETAYLARRDGTAAWEVGWHYGDPTCGLIDPAERWCLTGGQGLIWVALAGEQRAFFRQGDPWVQLAIGAVVGETDYCAVHALRLEGPTEVRVLLDPWAGYASTWLLDVARLTLRKLRDGPSLADRPYQAEVAF